MVAASDAVFVMAYSNIGLSPDGGGSWHLGRALPRQLATELLMLGERITSQRLHTLGMVNRISAPGSAMLRSPSIANEAVTPPVVGSVMTLM